MRKKLKELVALSLVKYRGLGFNKFRKYITSILVEGGALSAAQMMNNHSSTGPTLNHYYVTNKASEETFSDLHGNEGFENEEEKMEFAQKLYDPNFDIKKEIVKKEEPDWSNLQSTWGINMSKVKLEHGIKQEPME